MRAQPNSRQLRRPRSGAGISLIELLIAMGIMSIISAMILLSWFALSNSYSYSVTSNKARDNARQAIARLEREVRDAQSHPNTSEVALVRARPRWIVVSTTFNDALNAIPNTLPRLVMYRLYRDGELWRFQDANRNGVIADVDMSPTETWPLADSFDADWEQAHGEGGTLLVKDVVNDKVPSIDNPTPLFQYSRYESDGSLVQDDIYLGSTDRGRVVAVQINLMVDVNPQHSPIYTELQTTAQLRNQR